MKINPKTDRGARFLQAVAAWGLKDVTDDADERLALDRAQAFVQDNAPTPIYRSHLILLRHQDLWAYCLNLSTRCWSLSYGPFMQYCQPYPSRHSALIAGCEAIANHATEQRALCSGPPLCDCSDPMLAWARKLEPVDRLTLW